MLSTSVHSITLGKTDGQMNTFQRTVSKEAMHEEWLEIQAAQKDPARFRPLYNRYFEAIFRFVYNRTLNEELSADLCSQVFLKAIQRLGSYTFQGVPFSAWLFRIATNEVAQHYRSTKKNRVVGIDDANLQELFEDGQPEDREQLKQLMIKSLNQLRPADLEIIEMRFFEQRPFKEIADILGITESNAKVRTYRVLERIKKIMLKEGRNSDILNP
ncbi:MAG: sigma-70 family RNA polymerase sigma factor [Saprospiraceae bacterium]